MSLSGSQVSVERVGGALSHCANKVDNHFAGSGSSSNSFSASCSSSSNKIDKTVVNLSIKAEGCCNFVEPRGRDLTAHCMKYVHACILPV